MTALQASISRAGELHEEQGGVIFPGGRGLRAEGNFLSGSGGEDASLQEGEEVLGRFKAHVVVEGEKKGVPATAQEEAAVVFLTQAHRRKTQGEVIPSMTGGKFPDNGIQKEYAGRCGGGRGPRYPQSLSRREMGAGQAGEALEDL